MRAIGSVIVGYIVVATLVVGLMFGAAFAMGIDGIYEPGTYDITATWAIVSSVIGLFAAVVGGLVCSRMAGSKGPARALAGLILVIGLGMAGWTATRPGPAEPPPARTAQTPLAEVAKNSVQPAWMGWLNPFLGAFGVLVGARRRNSGEAAPRPAVSTPR